MRTVIARDTPVRAVWFSDMLQCASVLMSNENRHC